MKRDGRNTAYTAYTGHSCSRGMSVLNNSILSAEVIVRKLTSSSCYGSELSDTNADIFDNDNSSGRSAIYRLPTQKLLAVDRIFIYGFVSLISVVTGNGNQLHFKSIIPVGKPTASYILTPPKPLFCSRVLLTSSVVPGSWL